MEIAGVKFRFRGELEPESYLLSQNAYKTFASTDSDRHLHTVDIEISFAPPPITPSMVKIFEGDSAWQIFKQKENYIFSYHPPSSTDPLWSAYFDTSLSAVSVYLLQPPYEINFLPYLTTLLRTLTMYALVGQNGLIVHGAGIETCSKGIIFSGKSGSGKSTIANALNRDSRINVLSDERIVVRHTGDHYSMSGTPWPSDAELAMNQSVELSALCFIHHGKVNRFEALNAKTGMERLLPVATIPWYDAALIQPMLDFCGNTVADIPVFDLWLKPDSTIIDFVHYFRKGLPDGV